MLEIGRHDVPRRANLYAWVKPVRPVPPRRIFEIDERVLLDGTVDTPLDEAECREAAQKLQTMGVEAVAIVFLYALCQFHARATRRGHGATRHAPAHIALSSDVLPVFREYGAPWPPC